MSANSSTSLALSSTFEDHSNKISSKTISKAEQSKKSTNHIESTLQNQQTQKHSRCQYCQRKIIKNDDQTTTCLCSCNVCASCTRSYLREILKTNQPTLKCPMGIHRIYYDNLIKDKIFQSILLHPNNGKVQYMLLTIAVIFLIGSQFLDRDRNMQLNIVLLLLYQAKANVQPKHKYYFIYAMYIPIIYWFCMKNPLEFIQQMCPLHAIWFGFVHTELKRPQKMKLFLVWIAQIIWQGLFFVGRYYLIPFLFVD